MAAWMLYSAGVAVLIACAASAADVFLRGVRKPVRGVWLGAMLTALVLSGVSLVRMQSPDSVTAGSKVLMAEPLAVTADIPAGPAARALRFVTDLGRELRSFTHAGMQRAYAATQTAAGGRASSLLLSGWAAASILLVAFFCGTLVRMARARRAWPAHRIGDMRVLVSPATGPALVGLVRPAIVVPVWLLGETADRQQLVIQHEQEHLRAHDHAVIALACMIACLLPWNPAIWWLLRRARLAVELDCDARVLGRGARVHSYGSLLLDIAGRGRARPFSAPAIADSRTHLERRIIAMSEITRTPRHARSAAAGAAALLLGVAACTADMPTAAEIDDLDVAQAQMQAEKIGFIQVYDDDGATTFFVDGEQVTEQEAHALLADQVFSIELQKQATGVRIRATTNELRRKAVATTAADDTTFIFERRLPTRVRGEAGGSTRRMALTAERVALTRQGGPDSPLLVIDGVIAPATRSVRSLDPESIDRVEILKGAAARELYDDARAANGVILVTTKKTGSR